MTTSSILGRRQGRTVTNETELADLRHAAWHRQGVLTVRPADMTNEIDRMFLEQVGTRLYGARGEGGQ